MSRPPGEPTVKITMNLYEDDYHFLRQYYPDGYQIEIREMVRRTVALLKQRSRA